MNTLGRFTKHRAIPEQPIMLAQFATAQSALDYRAANGGWVYIREDASNALWFDAAYFTPSAIFRHPAASGNGRLL
jgi:hypothetical protein